MVTIGINWSAVFILLGCVATLIFLVAALTNLLLLRAIRNQKVRWPITLTIAIATVFGTYLYLAMPFYPTGQPLVVDHVFTSDGYELLVTQQFQDILEPYYVSFFYRKDDGPWYWYFLDPDALYWRAHFEIDETTKEARIIHSNTLVLNGCREI